MSALTLQKNYCDNALKITALNDDMWRYIFKFIHDSHLLPIILTSKDFQDIVVKSNRNYKLQQMKYYCSNSLVMLEWFIKAFRIFPWYWPIVIINTAESTENCHLHKLQLLHVMCPWNEIASHNAAAKGHLEVLKWLRNQDHPCPWD